MSSGSGGESSAPLPIGLLRVRDHCTFTWRTVEGRNRRIVDIEDDHCPECIAELESRGYDAARRPQQKDGIEPSSA